MPSKLPPRKDKNRVPRAKRAIAPAKKDAERVAKVIARAGLGSRREIEEWIAAGRVAVNGVVLESPAVTVTAEDAIQVDGAPLPEKERTRLYLYHKPRGVVTTNRDPEGRTTLFEILPKGLPRLVSIGRLDLNSEGLLLLTNDGGLARALELPETGWLRRYRVRAKGEIDQAKLDTLLKGITVEGIEYGPIEATLDRVQGANAWITVALREGKNREVRNVLAALGMAVNRLIRVSYGPFQLGDIPENGIDEVRTRILRDQIGAEIVAASGADFDGPIVEREIEEAPRRFARPAEDEAPRRGGRMPRRAEREPEGRARARHPEGEQEETRSFRIRSRRDDAEREVESRGTVADRKGRTVKVERVVAPPREEESRPPRRGRPPEHEEGRRPARPGARRPEGGFEERPRGRRPAEGRDFERDDARRAPSRFGDEPRGRRPRPQGEGREDFRRGDDRPPRKAPPRRRAEGEDFRRGDDRPARRSPPRHREEGEDFRPRREGGPARDGFKPRRREDAPTGRAPARQRRDETASGENFRPRRGERPEGGREERRPRSGPPNGAPKDRSGERPGAKPRRERSGEDVGFLNRGPRTPRGEGPPRGRGGSKGPPKGGPRGGAKGGPKSGAKRPGPAGGGKPPRRRT